MSAKCPLCGGSSSLVENWRDPVEPRDYQVLRCAACGVEFADPFRFPGGAWYEKYNDAAGYEEGTGGPSPARFEFVLARLAPGAKILDVGTAAGGFVKLARSRGFDAEGLELDRRMIAAAQREGLPVREGLLDEAFAAAHAGKFDAVTMFDVLEHLDDPKGILKLARKVLKPSGVVGLSTPNALRPGPFGRDSWDYPPHHLTRWTPSAMRSFLEREGWTVSAFDTGSLPAWEFSRVFADRSARALLRSYKSLRYGAGQADAPMSQLAPSAGGADAPDPARGRRRRLVAFYHEAFNVAFYPIFGVLAFVFRLTTPGAGTTLTVVADCRRLQSKKD